MVTEAKTHGQTESYGSPIFIDVRAFPALQQLEQPAPRSAPRIRFRATDCLGLLLRSCLRDANRRPQVSRRVNLLLAPTACRDGTKDVAPILASRCGPICRKLFLRIPSAVLASISRGETVRQQRRPSHRFNTSQAG